MCSIPCIKAVCVFHSMHYVSMSVISTNLKVQTLKHKVRQFPSFLKYQTAQQHVALRDATQYTDINKAFFPVVTRCHGTRVHVISFSPS